MRKYNLPKFETIVKATQGDTLAMQKIVNHYIGYITYFSKENGGVNYENAEEIKLQLMKAILQFKIDK